MDDGKTVPETASDKMVMGAAQASCELSLLVSEQNHSDLFLKALDNALNQFYLKKGICRERKISKSAKAKVADQGVKPCYQLREQMIHKIRAAMEAVMYGAEQVTTSKHRQFLVHLNRAQQAATTWSDSDYQKAIERFEREIHQVTHAKHKLFDNYSNVINNNSCREAGLKQLVPEANSPRPCPNEICR
jgi:hypothetical protein